MPYIYPMGLTVDTTGTVKKKIFGLMPGKTSTVEPFIRLVKITINQKAEEPSYRTVYFKD